MRSTKNRKPLIAALVVVVAALLLVGVYLLFSPKGETGEKTISFSVVLSDQTQTYTIETEEAYLRGALEQESLISGEEGSYGLLVTTVDGVTADSSKEEWWRLTKDGEMLSTGVDTTPIADGDHFEFTLVTGYDS